MKMITNHQVHPFALTFLVSIRFSISSALAMSETWEFTSASWSTGLNVGEVAQLLKQLPYTKLWDSLALLQEHSDSLDLRWHTGLPECRKRDCSSFRHNALRESPQLQYWVLWHSPKNAFRWYRWQEFFDDLLTPRFLKARRGEIRKEKGKGSVRFWVKCVQPSGSMMTFSVQLGSPLMPRCFPLSTSRSKKFQSLRRRISLATTCMHGMCDHVPP